MPPSVSDRKRQAIAAAALTLFARDGYERTSVDAIAAEAGVSKRTVYSHYGDKESLFVQVMQDTFMLMRDRFAEVFWRVMSDVTDVEKSLVSGIREVATEVSHTPERAMLLRLLLSELPHFPGLLDMWRGRAVQPILAELVTRLTASGLLSTDDPGLAADHLSALTFGQINNRSLMGTIPLSDAQIDQIVTSGVRVFLCAYGAEAKYRELAAGASPPAASSRRNVRMASRIATPSASE
jgi:TetR/AcrR family transcriptional regulator, mexJK operon transcriptional repressor